MLKLIFVSYFVLAVSKGEIKNVNSYNSPALRFDNYIDMHRKQHAGFLRGYDTQFEEFRAKYLDNLEVITAQLDLLTDAVFKNQARLSPMEYLSKAHHICINKYRSDLPSIDYARNELTRCGEDIYANTESILYKNLKIKESLEQFYESYFEYEIKLCANYSRSLQDYEYCVFNVTQNTSVYTIRNQEYFSIQFDAAGCEAQANIKQALRCNFAVQVYAISKIAEINQLIDICINKMYNCGPCVEYTCPEIVYLNTDHKNKTIQNPFYGHNESPECVMLRAPN